MYRYRRSARRAPAPAGRPATAVRCIRGRAEATARRRHQLIHINPLSGSIGIRTSHTTSAMSTPPSSTTSGTTTRPLMMSTSCAITAPRSTLRSRVLVLDKAHFNPDRDRWEIHGVMGPNELRRKVPGCSKGGVRNNTTPGRSGGLDLRPRAGGARPPAEGGRRDVLRVRIGLPEDEIQRWQEIHRRNARSLPRGRHHRPSRTPRTSRNSIGTATAGYPNIQRLDRILRAEADQPDRYSLSRRRIRSLFFLFSHQELSRLLARLGYQLTEETARRTIVAYERHLLARVDAQLRHARGECWLGSTQRVPGSASSSLSRATWACAGRDHPGRHPLGRDGGASTWCSARSSVPRSVMMCSITVMIDQLDGLHLAMQFRRAHITVSLDGRRLTVAALADGYRATIKVGVGDLVREIRGGDSVAFLGAGSDAPTGRGQPDASTRAAPGNRVDLVHRRRAHRFAMQLVAGDAARADGKGAPGPHSAADDLGARAVHLARVSGGRGPTPG